MQTLILGETKKENGTEGFILLRDLMVMFIVIICFAAVLASMAAVSRQGSHLLENVKKEINTRNILVLERINNEQR